MGALRVISYYLVEEKNELLAPRNDRSLVIFMSDSGTLYAALLYPPTYRRVT